MIKRVLLALITIYQVTISVFLGPRCRFYPSCSAYSSQAIEIHGVVKGLGMTAARVCKCHPFHPGGFDPVPTEHPLSTVEKGI